MVVLLVLDRGPLKIGSNHLIFSVTGQEKKQPFNTGDHVGRFDCIVETKIKKLRVTMTTRLSQNVADKFHINNLK